MKLATSAIMLSFHYKKTPKTEATGLRFRRSQIEWQRAKDDVKLAEHRLLEAEFEQEKAAGLFIAAVEEARVEHESVVAAAAALTSGSK